MLLSNKMTVTIWLTLLWIYLRIWPSSSWILPSAAEAFPASVTKKIALIPFPTSNLAWYVRMYVCTYVQQMRWQSLSHLSYHPCRHLLYCKTIVVPYVDTNAKVTNFFPFCTIGISMYQKRILPYIIIPYFLTPSFFPFGAFQTDRRTDKSQHPPIPYFFFFSTERAGPYPQAQLYWAGRTMGWMADW
jgi:hypothetical protein